MKKVQLLVISIIFSLVAQTQIAIKVQIDAARNISFTSGTISVSDSITGAQAGTENNITIENKSNADFRLGVQQSDMLFSCIAIYVSSTCSFFWSPFITLSTVRSDTPSIPATRFMIARFFESRLFVLFMRFVPCFPVAYNDTTNVIQYF